MRFVLDIKMRIRVKQSRVKDRAINSNNISEYIKRMKTYYLPFLLVCCFFLGNGKTRETFDRIGHHKDIIKTEPESFEWEKINSESAVIPGDFADPSIIRVGDTYYATGTSSEWAPHFPIFESKDLANWQQIGYVLNETPSWAASSFWAPELFYNNETFYVYYVAKKKSDKISCIGVATARNPAQGFTDKGIVLPFGTEAIDPFIVKENEQLYITWKAYGLDNRPIEILGCKLSKDGLKPESTPFTLLKDDLKKGLEGQCLVKRDNYYYLFYSIGGCCGPKCSYEVCIARSESLEGEFLKFRDNPVLTENDKWKCPGHGTVVETKEGRYFYLYHAYNKSDHIYTGRQGMLAEVVWDRETGWPQIKNNHFPEDKAQRSFAFFDDFSTSKISLAWQWDFRNTTPLWQIKAGNLYLSGKSDTANKTGTALTARPVKGDYNITTSVVNENASLKGLVVYGDANQSVGIGLRDNMIEVFEVKSNKRTILSRKEKTNKGEVFLKIGVEEGYKYRFFWSQKKDSWNEIKAGEGSYYNGDFLPPWDRSPRPGLLHYGEIKEPAGFSFFKIDYN